MKITDKTQIIPNLAIVCALQGIFTITQNSKLGTVNYGEQAGWC